MFQIPSPLLSPIPSKTSHLRETCYLPPCVWDWLRVDGLASGHKQHVREAEHISVRAVSPCVHLRGPGSSKTLARKILKLFFRRLRVPQPRITGEGSPVQVGLYMRRKVSAAWCCVKWGVQQGPATGICMPAVLGPKN